MHPILRIFLYQYDASLSVCGSCQSYGTTVGILGDSPPCNIRGCLTAKVSTSDVVGIGQQAGYECDE